MRGDYKVKGQWKSYFRVYGHKAIGVIILIVFLFGLIGWLDGFGDQITKEVTEVVKEEADPFHTSLLTGTVEILVHRWFDFDEGLSSWKDLSIKGEMLTTIEQHKSSKVISVGIKDIYKTGENTAEVTVIVLREVTVKEGEEFKTEKRVDLLRVPFIYAFESIEPLSSPIVEKYDINYGVDLSQSIIQLEEADMLLINKLAESYVIALSQGNRQQLEFLFKDQKQAPDPVTGKTRLLNVFPIKKEGDTVTFLVKIEQIEESGIRLIQNIELQAQKEEDRYLILKQFVGGITYEN